MDAWTDATIPVLSRVAERPYGHITYKDLAEELQRTTGYRTRTLLGNWIGRVLEPVIGSCLDQGLPPLTSLVVHTSTGDVGDGYHNPQHPYRSLSGDRLEAVAAADRLACYRFFCPDLPADAEPRPTSLHSEIEESRRRSAAATRPERQVCDQCFMEVPRTGVCDNCG
ncbi:hypothetical protein CGZ93_05740 [Enemella dayhoffiae]|uniref:Uncharacterized protein n=2 Tax=Enemella dayhoffiae TaxID=2016507 RepID=A0A255H816_9ACTN|nr:hypothetical protein CGZ93_05740 [Enemella dayhoffiae]